MKRIFIHLMIFVLCTSSFGLNVPLITINSSDNIGDSRTNINENFSQLSNAVLCIVYFSTNGTRLSGTYQLVNGSNTSWRIVGTNLYIDNIMSLSGYVSKTGDSEIDGKITVLSKGGRRYYESV